MIHKLFKGVVILVIVPFFIFITGSCNRVKTSVPQDSQGLKDVSKGSNPVGAAVVSSSAFKHLKLPLLGCRGLGCNQGVKAIDAKITLVNFWASWCEPCRREMKDLFFLHQQLQAQGFRLLLISVDESEQAALRFLKNYEMPKGVVSVWDPKGVFAKSVDVYRFPESLVVDQQATVISRISGEQLWASGDVISWFKSKLAP